MYTHSSGTAEERSKNVKCWDEVPKMTYWGVNEKIHSRYLFVVTPQQWVHIVSEVFAVRTVSSGERQPWCQQTHRQLRPAVEVKVQRSASTTNHCCVIDNLMIVLMSYLDLCFWHYCAWEHLCLCTVAPYYYFRQRAAFARFVYICQQSRWSPLLKNQKGMFSDRKKYPENKSKLGCFTAMFRSFTGTSYCGATQCSA